MITPHTRSDPAPSSGVCELIIRINDLIAAVGKWEPPVGIFGIGPPPGVGHWEPPGGIVGIVMTPNDAVVLQVKSVNARRRARGMCQADFVVLATSETPPLTDGF